MRYSMFLFHTKSSKSGVYFTLAEHLNSDKPHMASGNYTGQLSSNALNSTAPAGLTSTVLCPKLNAYYL